MFENNIGVLTEHQPKLAETLLSMSIPDTVELFQSEDGNYNIVYRQLPLHDLQAPVTEALNAFNTDVPTDFRDENTILFIYGLGLGYLFKRAFLESKGYIVIYEPNLDVLRFTLEAVDFSKELSSKRVFIITDLDLMRDVFSLLYLRGNSVKTTALPMYAEHYPEGYLGLLNQIQDLMGILIIAQNTALVYTEDFIRMSLQCLGSLLKYPDAGVMHNRFQNVPGVVVSAGPSLDKPGVLEALKANQENMIISCVGQAAKALDRAGITPDFVSYLEVKDVSSQLDGLSCMNDINLIVVPQAHKKIFEVSTKRKFVAYSNNEPISHWVSAIKGQPVFGYNHFGTVSITALIHLMLMGCNPIFLVGQDLAYPEGQTYAKNSIYSGARYFKDADGTIRFHMDNKDDFNGVEGFWENEEDWLAKGQEFFANLPTVKGWNGERLETNESFLVFTKQFAHIQQTHPEFNLVNCSEGGAYLEGYEHLPFVQALEKYQVKNCKGRKSLNELLEQEYSEQEPGSPIYQRAYEQYKRDLEDLRALKVYLESGQQLGNSILKQLQRERVVSNSLSSRIRKFLQNNEDIVRLSQAVQLINELIVADKFKFTHKYGMKMTAIVSDPGMDGAEEVKECMDAHLSLYNALSNAIPKLQSMMDEAFHDFPVSEKEPLLT